MKYWSVWSVFIYKSLLLITIPWLAPVVYLVCLPYHRHSEPPIAVHSPSTPGKQLIISFALILCLALISFAPYSVLHLFCVYLFALILCLALISFAPYSVLHLFCVYLFALILCLALISFAPYSVLQLFRVYLFALIMCKALISS